MTPTVAPIQRLSRSLKSFAMKSAFCSRVVSYLGAFMPAKMAFPRNGMCFTHESLHNGGDAASAVNLWWMDFAGTLTSAFSAVILLGQSRDQSTE